MKKFTKYGTGILLILTILALSLLPVTTASAVSDYDWYATITIDADLVSDDHSGFQMLFQGTYDGTAGEPDLRTVGNGGDIENTVATGGVSGSLTTPADLVFSTDADGINVIDYEYEYYDAATGEITAWLEIPTMDSVDDLVIYIVYGASGITTSQEDVAGTWPSYLAVWHMADNTTSQILDSSSSNNHLTKYAANQPIQSVGNLGYSQTFDGTNDYALHDGRIETDWDSNFSIQVYASVENTTANNSLITYGHSNDSPYFSWLLDFQGASDKHRFGGYSGDWLNLYSVEETSPGDYYLAVSANSQVVSLYVDGVFEDSGTQYMENRTDTYDAVTVGADRKGIQSFFDGDIDEVRITSGALTLGWIETTNESFTPSTFYAVGSAAAAGATPTPTASNTPTETPTPTASNTPTPTLTPTPTPPAIVMGNSSISGVPAGLKTAVEVALNSYRPDEDIGLGPLEMANMWAITSYTESTTSDYWWVSVAGMLVPDPGELDEWDLSYSIWTGLGIAEDNQDTTYTAYMDGSAGYTIMLDTAGLADIAHPDEGGLGSGSIYFPWAAGYTAYYGSKGVHGAGPNDPAWGGVGWRAVDWVGGAVGYAGDIFPNGAYVSQSGKISYVCQDDVQTWVQIGDFLYGHIQDNATLRMDVYHSQGSYLGAIVTGTHLTPASSGACPCPSGGSDCIDAKCGYMCQQETSYHIHWGFIPSGSYFTTEEWTLNTSSEEWRRGIDTVGPGQYMLAEWSSRPIVPTPGPTVTPGGPTVTPGVPIIVNDGGGGGGQIWDGFIAGMKNSVQNRVDDLNSVSGTEEHQPRKYIQLAVSGVRIMIRSVYILLRSNLDLRVTIAVVLLILVMEPVRMMGAIWMWIKSKIPFIG